MENSDHEYGSENDELQDDILGQEDLFNDEADEDDTAGYGIDEAEEDNKADITGEEAKEKIEKKLKPKRVVKNPRVKLNYDTLKGPTGLSALKKLFSNFKFKGNNHEQEDLTKIMGILQQWMCYQLCPSYDFESCMLQLESLGKKKVVQTLMKKYRLGMDDWGDNKSDDDEENNGDVNQMETHENFNNDDNFNALLDREIANADIDNLDLSDSEPILNESQGQSFHNQTECVLTPEQLERIARNKKLAEERRLKRISCQQEQMEISVGPVEPELPIKDISLNEDD